MKLGIRKPNSEKKPTDYIEEIVYTRGQKERKFWDQLSSIKEALQKVEPRGRLNKFHLHRAASALEKAKSAYLYDNDLTEALRYQEMALRAIGRVKTTK